MCERQPVSSVEQKGKALAGDVKSVLDFANPDAGDVFLGCRPVRSEQIHFPTQRKRGNSRDDQPKNNKGREPADEFEILHAFNLEPLFEVFVNPA